MTIKHDQGTKPSDRDNGPGPNTSGQAIGDADGPETSDAAGQAMGDATDQVMDQAIADIDGPEIFLGTSVANTPGSITEHNRTSKLQHQPLT
ncbi:unnamed protein product [Lupinus luteus]|uniref:Late embryogenesis abundant protein n=1 Tax=Lupinus luteus TaxID=3873 RepID=A0AAV1WZC6_LUPLU